MTSKDQFKDQLSDTKNKLLNIKYQGRASFTGSKMTCKILHPAEDGSTQGILSVAHLVSCFSMKNVFIQI